MIQNLSQLKRALHIGARFEIVAHMRPENIGQIRRVTKAGATSFYSVVDKQPEHKLSQGNNGLGVWCEFNKAPFWKFEGGVCTLFEHKGYGENTPSERVIMSFKMLER